MSVTGIDQSWGYATPKAVQAAGVLVVSMYFSHDSSKNITAAKVKAYHKVGVASLVNWEAVAGAPLQGAAQGKADATEAVRQLRALIKAVGYAPLNRIVIYFSCDKDVTASQISGAVAAYYRAAATVCHAAGFGVGVYGEADVVKYLAANKITDAEWQTYAWSGGRLDPAADFYQYSNGQTLGGASVDYDRVIHAADLGAWWPKGHKLNTAPGTAPKGLKMDPDVKAAFAAINTRLDAMPRNVWTTTIGSVNAWSCLTTVNARAARLEASTASIAQLLSAASTGVLARVAGLQAAVAKIPTSPDEVVLDTAAVVEGVVAKVKAIAWKVSA